jgi:hypothetical protein
MSIRSVPSHTDLPVHLRALIPHKRRGRVDGITTAYGLVDRGVGVRVPVGSRIFISQDRLDRIWGPLNLLSNGHRGLFLRG